VTLRSADAIRVAILANSALLRAGLAALLTGDPTVELVGAVTGVVIPLDGASVGSALQAQVASLSPDVVLWVPSDVSDPDAREGAGDEEDAHLDGEPSVAYVAVIDRVDATGAQRALTAGAGAVVSLDIDADALGAVIRAVAAGLTVLPPDLSVALLGARLPAATASAALPISALPESALLTPREREVLALLAEGLPNKAIAPRLGIAENTVKAHVASIYEKVGAGNRAEAVVAAARLGLLML
jgi:DNA-binding NarL/FixJ family response regulator